MASVSKLPMYSHKCVVHSRLLLLPAGLHMQCSAISGAEFMCQQAHIRQEYPQFSGMPHRCRPVNRRLPLRISRLGDRAALLPARMNKQHEVNMQLTLLISRCKQTNSTSALVDATSQSGVSPSHMYQQIESDTSEDITHKTGLSNYTSDIACTAHIIF